MKPPTFCPAYVGLYPALAEVARAHGYALAVHGTVNNDMDLIAVPWAEEFSSSEELIVALAQRVSFILDPGLTFDSLFKPPLFEEKPHGRKAYLIPLDAGARLDVSVTPAAVDNSSPPQFNASPPNLSVVEFIIKMNEAVCRSFGIPKHLITAGPSNQSSKSVQDGPTDNSKPHSKQ